MKNHPTQGKLLIKLVDQNPFHFYELVKAFMGPFKAGFYQTFALLEVWKHITGDDPTERVIHW